MEGDFRVDKWRVQPQLYTVIGPDNTTTKLEPKVMEVLVYLADHADEVLPKERILQAVWADPLVTENALACCIAELRRIFQDDVTDPRVIQTIADKGYRLLAQVSKLKTPAYRYQMVEKIGEGGMGVVYRGRDERLGRDVAIKVLPAGMLNDEPARRRFCKEALALSKLNHQNIRLVYDFDNQEGVDFLVMEYVPGRTLREMIAAGLLPEKEISRLGAQMAEGLAAAHTRGVVHCDLKPGNLMVTPDGRLKILDFGLAKAVRPESQEVSTDSSTRPRSAGGTLPYMAPEQLIGGPVDPRSDIYAMGNVLYEMATGRPPFQEPLPTALVNEIVHKPPPPPGRFRADLSSRMEELILKCLEKDPENRYQSAKELLVDLRRTGSPAIPGVLSEKRRKARWPAWSIAALFIAAGLAVSILPRFWPSRVANQPVLAFEPFQVTSRTSWEGQPALSPDGSRIAYSAYESGNQDIYVTDIRGSAQSRLTDDPAEDSDPAWFPDGSAIAFTSNRSGRLAIWKVGAVGGGATLLLDDAFQPDISPDQKNMAFARALSTGTSHIGVAPISNPADVRILTDASDGTVNASYPAWSPDGRNICYVDRKELWFVDASGGPARRITSDGEDKSEPAWSPDGSHIYFSSYRGGAQALWRINASGGVAERVTYGTGPEGHPSLSKDGRLLAHATGNIHRRLVLIDRESGRENVLPGLEWWMPAIAPDGSKIVFISFRSSSERNLWMLNLDRGNPSAPPSRLTEIDGVASHPVFSPDGRWVAYYRILQNKRDIWIVPAVGGSPVQFTADSRPRYPSWSPDGSMIAFVSERSGSSQVWIAPVKDGKAAGRARQVTRGEFTALAPVWSPDGARIAFQAPMRKDQNEVWVVPSDGSAPARQVTNGADVRLLRWDYRTGDLIVSGSWGEDRIGLRRVSLETGTPTPYRPPVDFGGTKASKAYGFFDISADGKWLVLAREDASGHVWLLRATSTLF